MKTETATHINIRDSNINFMNIYQSVAELLHADGNNGNNAFVTFCCDPPIKGT
jgi:hypothetical protein